MDKNIRLAGITYESLVNGPGMRRVYFIQGCIHNCPGCQNPTTHSMNGGEDRNMDALIDDLRDNPMLRGVTFSGGDPFEQADKCTYMAEKIRNLHLNIWCYTGYTYEEILENKDNKKGWKEFLNNIDVLVDGVFIKEQMQEGLKFRGSANQRIIDVQKSLSEGKVVEMDY